MLEPTRSEPRTAVSAPSSPGPGAPRPSSDGLTTDAAEPGVASAAPRTTRPSRIIGSWPMSVVLPAMLAAVALVAGSGVALAQSGDPIIPDPANLLPGEVTEDWVRSEFVWPLSGSTTIDRPLTSPFGPRLHANQGLIYDFHRGIDVAAPMGTPVRAMHDGRIASAGLTPGFADRIIELVIEADNRPTLHVFHSHLSAVMVTVGDVVTQGQVIGWTGASSSGLEHLHLEVRRGGRFQSFAINPLTYLPFPESNMSDFAISAVTPTGVAGHSDVTVSVRMPFEELDFEGLSLRLHHQLEVLGPPPVDIAIPDLSAWSFDLGPLNAANTPFVDGFSDLTILDDPLVALGAGGSAQALISPARFNGRNPPWDRAGYEVTFLDVPVGDLESGQWYLAAILRDVFGNESMTWHVTNFEDGAPQCNGEAATVVLALGQTPTPQRDVIVGTSGDDVIAADAGDDVICGLDGNDRIWGQLGNDQIFGGAGNDHLRGSAGDDLVFGGLGADDLNGGTGNDEVYGEEGDDPVVRGGTGEDLVDAGPGADALVAGNGGSDTVLGGAGADKVTGGPRPDVVRGGDGDDEVKGRKGADQLFGDAGDDVLRGGPQPDMLDGGDGLDECSGGTTAPVEGSPPPIENDSAVSCETILSVP